MTSPSASSSWKFHPGFVEQLLGQSLARIDPEQAATWVSIEWPATRVVRRVYMTLYIFTVALAAACFPGFLALWAAEQPPPKVSWPAVVSWGLIGIVVLLAMSLAAGMAVMSRYHAADLAWGVSRMPLPKDPRPHPLQSSLHHDLRPHRYAGVVPSQIKQLAAWRRALLPSQVLLVYAVGRQRFLVSHSSEQDAVIVAWWDALTNHSVLPDYPRG